jgi:hypothetical protein
VKQVTKMPQIQHENNYFQARIICALTHILFLTDFYISSHLMNQTIRTKHSFSSAYLFNELNFQLVFISFGSRTIFNKSITESRLELFSSWFSSLSDLFILQILNKTFDQFKKSLISNNTYIS